MSDSKGVLPAATAVVAANAHNFFGMYGTLKGVSATNVPSGGVLLPSEPMA